MPILRHFVEPQGSPGLAGSHGIPFSNSLLGFPSARRCDRFGAERATGSHIPGAGAYPKNTSSAARSLGESTRTDPHILLTVQRQCLPKAQHSRPPLLSCQCLPGQYYTSYLTQYIRFFAGVLNDESTRSLKGFWRNCLSRP